MKPRIVFHYFLYLAIILGAFSSMAQNDYGLAVVSWSCYLFSLSVALELFQNFKSISWDKKVELFSLSTLLLLFGLRAAYIHFAYIETILLIACLLLILVYLLHASKKTKVVGNKRLKNLVLVYYLSLILYTSSMVITIVLPSLTEIVGGFATALLIIFMFGALISGEQLIDGVSVKTTDFLRKQAGYSIVLMTGFLLITVYSGLSMIGWLPSLYTDKVPHAYIELINNAETGKEQAVNGVYQHQLYKEAYDKFMLDQGLDK